MSGHEDAEAAAQVQPPAGAVALAGAIGRLRADVDALLEADQVADVPERAIQDLVVMAARLLVNQREKGLDTSPYDGTELTATEVLVTASTLLQAANLEVFELTMWNGFTSL